MPGAGGRSSMTAPQPGTSGSDKMVLADCTQYDVKYDDDPSVLVTEYSRWIDIEQIPGMLQRRENTIRRKHRQDPEQQS